MDLTVSQPKASYLSDQDFFTRLALALAAIIVLGFLQWALRGFVNPLMTPIWIHLHAIAMLAWLGTLVMQNSLAGRGNLARHRQFGWASLALVLAVVGLGVFSGQMAVALHRVPPFFTDSYFIALTHIEVFAFSAVVVSAIALRRSTEWHRRLMLGATVILMEPALGRVLPMPLLGQVGGAWLESAIQIGFLGILARHDIKVQGPVHRATIVCLGAIIGTHALIQTLAGTTHVAAYAEAIAHGSSAS